MTYEFINRNRETILFKREGDVLEMIGGSWFRYLFNTEDSTYDAVDPSGGPFISVGSDLEWIHTDLKGMRVESIDIEGESIKFKITETKDE